MRACRDGNLADTEVKFSEGAACCVVVASKGYPQKYETGFEMTLPKVGGDTDIYVAGAKIEDGKLVNAGGRVLGAVGKAETLEKAIEVAYGVAKEVKFENAYFRNDIGKKALAAK